MSTEAAPNSEPRIRQRFGELLVKELFPELHVPVPKYYGFALAERFRTLAPTNQGIGKWVEERVRFYAGNELEELADAFDSEAAAKATLEAIRERVEASCRVTVRVLAVLHYLKQLVVPLVLAAIAAGPVLLKDKLATANLFASLLLPFAFIASLALVLVSLVLSFLVLVVVLREVRAPGRLIILSSAPALLLWQEILWFAGQEGASSAWQWASLPTLSGLWSALGVAAALSSAALLLLFLVSLWLSVLADLVVEVRVSRRFPEVSILRELAHGLALLQGRGSVHVMYPPWPGIRLRRVVAKHLSEAARLVRGPLTGYFRTGEANVDEVLELRMARIAGSLRDDAVKCLLPRSGVELEIEDGMRSRIRMIATSELDALPQSEVPVRRVLSAARRLCGVLARLAVIAAFVAAILALGRTTSTLANDLKLAVDTLRATLGFGALAVVLDLFGTMVPGKAFESWRDETLRRFSSQPGP